MSETTTLTLTDFLLARITEDETGWDDLPHASYCHSVGCDCGAFRDHRRIDCEAKRRIVGLHAGVDGDCATCGHEIGWTSDDAGGEYFETDRCPDSWPCATLRALALPYADHPDWREEWRP